MIQNFALIGALYIETDYKLTGFKVKTPVVRPSRTRPHLMSGNLGFAFKVAAYGRFKSTVLNMSAKI